VRGRSRYSSAHIRSPSSSLERAARHSRSTRLSRASTSRSSSPSLRPDARSSAAPGSSARVFVVVADEADGHVRELGRSKSFWRVGGEGFREHAAESAWDELVEDLRTSGWEPDSERRSDFYVLLREVEDVRGGASILPTLEAYTHGAGGSKGG
jgi:hypothetical protein